MSLLNYVIAKKFTSFSHILESIKAINFCLALYLLCSVNFFCLSVITKMPVNHRFLTTQNRARAKISVHDPLSLTGRFRHAIRTLRPETIPMVVVVSAGLGGGAIAMIHKLWTDPQLRKFPAFEHKK
ncbi:6026_t:CDS:2 [Dentiscutata heterogama]|uniref:6026_t:CDS:1 n=1 Tax=Dentiscutata heterogama TaxID=1316150 RepID=A0ACA9KB11_9GLOM|nr:6026_t:CDS:2 [Dentiscutata heterogama]